jgi:DNA-binding transcriptional LysR family regulator
MRPLDLRKLHHAIVLESECNFARASERLHLSQSALTRSIQALEDDLGLHLFERNRSGVRATPEGRRILEQGRELLLRAGTIRREAELIREAESGEVSFGVGPAMAGIILSPLMKAMSRDETKVTVRADIDSPPALLESLFGEKIEFFIADTRLLDSAGQRGAAILPLRYMETGFYVRAGHPLATGEVITADQLIRFPLLMPNLGEDHWTLIGALYGGNFDRTSVKHLMCNDFHSLKAAAMDSDGILMCVQDTLETELSDGTLQRLEMTQPHSDIGWNIGMVSLEGRRLSRAGQMLFERIRRILHVDATTT